MYTLMLLLHVFILCGRCSQDEYSLNQAIRNEFTRGAGSVSGGLRSVGDWWGWSLTTLLDGLHGGGASTAGPLGAQPGALGGKCYLLGTPVIQQLRDPSGGVCELAVVGAGLACHAASSHLATLAGEVTDHFHRGRFRGSMDLTVAASWNQRVTWLQGTLSFLLTLKFICFIGIPSTRASCSFLLRRSLAGICTAGLVGILTLAAHCHLRAVPPGTFADFSRGLLFHLPGRSQTDTSRRLSGSDLWALAWCCGALFTVVSTTWWGMLRGSLTTLARKRKSFQSQSLVSLADVTACMRGAARAWLGLERPQREEVEMAGRRNYYLDEVSDLLDELLWKIHGLSDSLQRPRPELRFGDTGETRAEGRPSVGVSA